ncbi:hypothetical protein F0223_17495 [Vibrio coralliilyticus]|uniref:hypothetical protein n=1 Tax=Vibrio TaxID=662 RepID=UPI0005087A2D|nr:MULTISPECIES: hypothetical protein [Vibrio]KFI10737.1 hypothetical protein IX95_17995 [Vibrio sp. B183]NOI20021.1 hypothetical protein [Vibrio coralliilyticus]
MFAQVEKPKENKSRAIANCVAQKKSNGKQGFGLLDNRSIGQRHLQNHRILQRAVDKGLKVDTPVIHKGNTGYVIEELTTEKGVHGYKVEFPIGKYVGTSLTIFVPSAVLTLGTQGINQKIKRLDAKRQEKDLVKKRQQEVQNESQLNQISQGNEPQISQIQNTVHGEMLWNPRITNIDMDHIMEGHGQYSTVQGKSKWNMNKEQVEETIKEIFNDKKDNIDKFTIGNKKNSNLEQGYLKKIGTTGSGKDSYRVKVMVDVRNMTGECHIVNAYPI